MISSREGKVIVACSPRCTTEVITMANQNGEKSQNPVQAEVKKYANYLKRKNVRVQVAIG